MRGRDAVLFKKSIGALALSVYTTHVVALWVAPQARRRGVGRALLGAVEREALGAGAETLSLWVREDNTVALRLYGALGYAATGERHPVPGGEGLVELRYARVLAPGSLPAS